MTKKRYLIIGAAVVLAAAGNILAVAAPWQLIIENREGGQNYLPGVTFAETGSWGPTSAKSTAPGCTAAGSRYFNTPNTGRYVEFYFTCPATGTYNVANTWGNSSTGVKNVSAVLMERASGTVVASKTFDTGTSGGLQNTWATVGDVALTGGVQYKLRFGETHDQTATWRVHVQGFRVSIPDLPCTDNPVTLQVPLISGDTEVTVTGLDTAPAPTAVKVYADTGTGWTLIGTNNAPGTTGTATVTVSPALAPGAKVVATQVVNGAESCKDGTGTDLIVDDCHQVPIVDIAGVLLTNDTTVPVSGVISTATKVEVYVDGVLKGTNNTPTAGTTTVTLDPGVTLAAAQAVTAKQFLRTLAPCAASDANEVDNANQLPTPVIRGLVDAGRTQVRVTGIMAGATAVSVYDGANLIGTNTAPTAGVTVVDVSALVEGHTIVASQFNRIESLLSAGRRVTAPWIIEDFDGPVATVWTGTGYLTGVERTWYQALGTSYTEFGLLTGHSAFSSQYFRIEDNGGPNGSKTRFEQIFPADGIYHVKVQMLVEEPEGCMYNGLRAYQVGLKLNGEYPLGAPAITSPVGIYGGPLTSGRDGTSETVPYMVTVGNVNAKAGDSLLMVFSTSADDATTGNHGPSAYSPETPRPRMLIDTITLVPGPKPMDCNDVPNVVTDNAPLEKTTGNGQITVKSILNGATGVSVYANGETMINATGAPVNPNGNTEITVETLPLQPGWTISATQTIDMKDGYGVREGCVRNLGPVVGSGENSPLLICLGIRETTDTGAVGSVGSVSGPIEWVGVSSTISSAPQGKLLSTDTRWQTVTFAWPAAGGQDPVHAAMGTVNSNGAIDGAKGVLEHIGFTLKGPSWNSGRYKIFIDEVYNGDVKLCDFNDITAFPNASQAMFRLPGTSITTSTLLLASPNVAQVDNTEDANGAGQSLRVEFQFAGVGEKYWCRLTTDKTAADTMPMRSPVIDLTKPITMKIKLFGQPACGPVFADSDGDSDVDMVDYAAFQRCLTIGSTVVAPECGCFDHPFNNVIGADDLTAFHNCASGPGVPATAGCGN